jgi:hypothetical protein
MRYSRLCFYQSLFVIRSLSVFNPVLSQCLGQIFHLLIIYSNNCLFIKNNKGYIKSWFIFGSILIEKFYEYFLLNKEYFPRIIKIILDLILSQSVGFGFGKKLFWINFKELHSISFVFVTRYRYRYISVLNTITVTFIIKVTHVTVMVM